MELRKRNINARRGSHSRPGSKKSKGSRSASLDVAFTRIVFVLILGFAAGLVFVAPHKVLDLVDGLVSSKATEYGVVIDAGSTGSRVLAFGFHRHLVDKRLVLDDELWYQVKPGLSAYHKKPEDAKEGLEELLQTARKRIPAEKWSSTPVLLKATAGLRLLGARESQSLLDIAEEVLRNSGLKMMEKPSIMEPEEEGILAWVTVNFLADTLADPASTMATLDLGGGSTQITFAVAEHEKDHKRVHELDLFENLSINLYSHSYLGLGLMSAREEHFKSSDVSSCIRKDKVVEFREQKVKGDFDANKCNVNVASLVKDVENVTNKLSKDQGIALISYFYDRAIDAGLFNEGIFESSQRIEDFDKASSKICTKKTEPDFGCFDLVYISKLLKNGYGFEEKREVRVLKKIKGHETSWGLGAALKMLK